MKFVLINVVAEQGFKQKIKKAKKEKGKIGIDFQFNSNDDISIQAPPKLRGNPSNKRYTIEESLRLSRTT